MHTDRPEDYEPNTEEKTMWIAEFEGGYQEVVLARSSSEARLEANDLQSVFGILTRVYRVRKAHYFFE